MKRSLFCLFLLVGLVPALMAQAPPKNSIIVEKVDPTRFPIIDVHFTVIDNVPGTEFYDLEANDGNYTLTVKEKRVTPPETSYQVVADADIKDSQNRSMASCLTVDRSGSMTAILQHVKDACVSFVNSIPDGDKTAVLFFQGDDDYDGMYFHKAEGNDKAAELQAFCEKYGSSSGGMTPMFDAWELSVTSIDTFANSMDTLCVVCLTDGYNTSSSNRPNSVISLGNSYRLPIYNIAFPKIKKEDGIVSLSDSVNDSLMLDISSGTNAAYFEPVPPYPKVPPTPAKDNGEPDGVNDEEAGQYFVDMMTLLQRLIKDDDEAEFDTFASYIHTYVTSPEAEDFDEEYFTDLEIDDGQLNQVAIQSLTYTNMETQASEVAQNVLNTVSDEDIEKFYNDQMFTMFNKIRKSKKRLYRMSYETPNKRLDGSIRDIEIGISFSTYDNFQYVTVDLSGKTNARYAAPMIAEEDHESLGKTTVDPDDPLFKMILKTDPAPRLGNWTGDPMQIEYTIDLMGRYEADGEPLKIATLKNDGTVVLSSDDPADNPFVDEVSQSDAESLLKSTELDVTANTSSGLVKTFFFAYTPTCIPDDPADPAASFPKGNPFAHEFRQKPLWYQVTPTLKKRYSYTRRYTYVKPDDSIQLFEFPSEDDVKLTLPPIITYVYDKTPPSITLWACPDRETINRVTLAEGEIHKSTDGSSLESTDLDSQATVRPFTLIVDGDYWDPTLSSNLSIEPALTSSSCLLRTTWPLQMDNGTELEGLFVREDERLMINILVRDNFDLNEDFQWTLDPANNPAPHNDFQNTDRFNAKEGDELFLLNLTKKYGDDDSHWSGFGTWQDRLSGYIPVLETEGVADPKVVDAELVLRDPNFAGGTGPDRHLVIKAFDKSGNQSMIEIPIKILPVDFDATKLGTSDRRK